MDQAVHKLVARHFISIRKSVLLLFVFHSSLGQNPEHAGHGESSSHESYIHQLEVPGRENWQKPEMVIALFGELRGKTILDLGAGSGYFTFRLAKAAGKVIAADVNESFLDYIQEKMKNPDHAGESGNIEIRKIPYDNPGLQPGEADGVLIVNTYHHLSQRIEYFKKVREGMKPGGILLIVDYTKGNGFGPPDSHKIDQETVLQEIRQSGFTQITSDTDLLEYQYILKCIK